MHLILHTQYYPPEIGAPQNRLSELATALSSSGFQVTVLTAMPNYPTGKIYPGFGGFIRQEHAQGVHIIRCAIYPTLSAAFLPRLFSYFSFVFSSLVAGLFCLPRADFLLTESPPLFLGISGWLLSRAKKARWIFNISDLWPASAAELGVIQKDSLSYRASRKLEEFLYKQAWLVTGQSKTILADISARLPGISCYHLSNGVQVSDYRTVNEPGSIGPEVNIAYAGLHGLAQGLDLVLHAASELQGAPVKFAMIGDGPEKADLMELSQKLGLHNIAFHPPIPKQQVPAVLAGADILLVPLKIQLTGAVPSKLYEAMAAGKPVILIAESEAAEIVRSAECGLVVRPGDCAGLVDAIQRLAHNPQERTRMGRNGRKAAEELYDRGMIGKKFAGFLTSAVEKDRALQQTPVRQARKSLER